MVVISDIIVQGVQMLLVLLLAPLLTGFVRKVKALLVRRKGPSIFQPYRDMLRLLRKEVVLAENASWLFRVTPYIMFAAIWVAAALVPTFATGLLFNWTARSDRHRRIIGKRAFLSCARGHGRRHQFRRHRLEPRSHDRSARRTCDAADRLLRIAGGGLHPVKHDGQLHGISYVGLRVSLGMALIALIMVALAENARIPIDNPATHLELTMVHEAMVLEYSGRHLAMIEFGTFLKLLLYVSLIACLFLPWKIARLPVGSYSRWSVLVAYVGKIRFWTLVGLVFETSIAKMRVFRVPELLGSALMLGLLGTLLLFVSRTF